MFDDDLFEDEEEEDPEWELVWSAVEVHPAIATLYIYTYIYI